MHYLMCFHGFDESIGYNIVVGDMGGLMMTHSLFFLIIFFVLIYYFCTL